ncbi:EF-P beta-lysylation protein EpmB [Nitrincola tapanii]|uniref:L-lysine 2,3-aminomutase n=1 Tax=Nitrincola tapanii TaxID=1708751 RepID=A0A5A9W1M6_9GAMM|nr:EF-P beta-lysylation protein EpmB [Nitrincola tapanii]KAA0874637.1 EF-P beta-lysylation protein EpmB [Nitrincola tapanii]
MSIPLHPLANDSEALSWQEVLRDAIRDAPSLLKALELPETLLEGAQLGHQLFPIRVPEPYLSRIEKGNPNDPLLRQVLPLATEHTAVPGFVADPLAEKQANLSSGLIHKYKNRILLILSGACAINCRYCFRRHFNYADNQLGKEPWQEVLTYLHAHPEVDEVIFSGGDPLATPDQRLAQLIDDLEALPQLKRLRIHSRLPVVIPQRLTDQLISRLGQSRLDTLLVLHINHPNEIDAQVRFYLAKARQQGIHLLNQAVLLRGINDNLIVQKTLSETLFAAGVIPYYLFLFDPVAGAAHFDLEDEFGQKLMGELQRELPGYLVPRLAREIPGRPAKTLLAPLLDLPNSSGAVQ